MSHKNDYDYRLKNRLNTFLEKKGVTWKQFASDVGTSLFKLRTWWEGNYCGDIKAIESKIKSVLDREINKDTLPKENSLIIETSNTKRVHDVCWLCREKHDLGIIVGDAGVGKTAGCELFANKFPDTILIKTLPSFSATSVIRSICSTLQLNEGLSLGESFDDVAAALKDSGRLVIVDEGELIAYRGLELLRCLYDRTSCGVVLVGLPALLGNIRGSHGQFRQLYSRVGASMKLSDINESDAEALVKHWLPESGDLWRDFWTVAGANARRLSKLVNMAKHISKVNNCTIDKEIILRAVEILIS